MKTKKMYQAAKTLLELTNYFEQSTQDMLIMDDSTIAQIDVRHLVKGLEEIREFFRPKEIYKKEKILKEIETNWEPDVQDKHDLDFPILEVNTRVYGTESSPLIVKRQKGEITFHEEPKGKATASGGFYFKEKAILELDDKKEFDTTEKAKQYVETWIEENYLKALEIIFIGD